MIIVESSAIRAVDIENKDLIILFNNGEKYRYLNASVEFDNLLNSDSVGIYFHIHIRSNFIYK